jgi:ABC-type sugar transport system permease subunit
MRFLQCKQPLRAILVLVTFLAAAAAQAVPITRTFNFSFTNFPAGSPQSAVIGSFGVTFDPTLFQDDLVANFVNLSINGVTYTTANTRVDHNLPDRLIFGGILLTNNSLHDNSDDFILAFHNTTGTPVYENFFYTVVGRTGFFGPATVSLTATTAVSIPEPDSLALLGLGLGAFGMMRRRKKT